MSASAGRVLLMPKGDYNNATTYSVLDWVLYNGKPYVAKQTTTGNLPTNTTYWQLLLDGSAEFAGLTDVDIDDLTLSDGQVPVYNATSGKWENGDASGGMAIDGSNAADTGVAFGDEAEATGYKSFAHGGIGYSTSSSSTLSENEILIRSISLTVYKYICCFFGTESQSSKTRDEANLIVVDELLTPYEIDNDDFYFRVEQDNTSIKVYGYTKQQGQLAYYRIDYSKGVTTASGEYSHAEGGSTIASGIDSHAEGFSTTASDSGSHAEGSSTTASGSGSHAEGSSTTASGSGSHAEGGSTKASGSDSHAEGSSTKASGNGSHAEGYGTTASGGYSHAEGGSTTASGSDSHAEGISTTASGGYSHAEGASTEASGTYSHAGGYGILAYRYAAFAHGNNNTSKFKFRGSTMSLKTQGHCFGFDMSGEEWTADAAITNSTNGCEGTILNSATVTMNIEPQGQYLLAYSTYTQSTGAIYGGGLRFIIGHGTAAGTPTSVQFGNTGTPPTVSMLANNKISIKNSSSSYATQFTLIRLN